jgi:hypothetical protein
MGLTPLPMLVRPPIRGLHHENRPYSLTGVGGRLRGRSGAGMLMWMAIYTQRDEVMTHMEVDLTVSLRGGRSERWPTGTNLGKHFTGGEGEYDAMVEVMEFVLF